MTQDFEAAILALAIATMLLITGFRAGVQLLRRSRRRRRGRRAKNTSAETRVFARPKPPWVKKEVLRLAALMPNAGCRQISATFNALWGKRRGMTVGKTYVADRIREGKLEILRLRKKIKNWRPRPLPKNLIWGLDLTYVDQEPVLGIIDHGTRACIALRRIRTKASIAILREILEVIERFGVPGCLRTDNERVLTSRIFRFGLRWLGIRHQRTERCAPWQNGRIERFFGTFKEALRSRTSSGEDPSDQDLRLFRFWYNHCRPHQHLDGRTPADAWNGGPNSTGARPAFFSEWDGQLAGFFFPP